MQEAKSKKQDIELLSPAGGPEQLAAAIRYGADAVYLAGGMFGMRAGASNFIDDGLWDAVNTAHAAGVKVYLACNTLPRNDELPKLADFLRDAGDIGVDALIISDMGVFDLAKKHAPGVQIHISTQMGVTNYAAASALHGMGAARVVLARELSLREIRELRENTPPALELEAFVHGAMCVSFSGRCLLSSYLTGRDANRGDCPQPCRWKYNLVEESRPGQYFPIGEADGWSYILNSRDLCMIGHIAALREAGVTSFKIEGRAKSAYYTAMTTNAYRCAIDAYDADDSGNFTTPAWIAELVNKVSHRAYSTGFYLGDEPGQVLNHGGYVRDYEVAAVTLGYKDGHIIASQRGKFSVGDELELIEPGRPPEKFTVSALFDGEGTPIEAAPHPTMTVQIPFGRPVEAGMYLVRRVCSG